MDTPLTAKLWQGGYVIYTSLQPLSGMEQCSKLEGFLLYNRQTVDRVRLGYHLVNLLYLVVT